MASINTLPIELLHKIVDLTVEDAIAVNDERLRRKILIRLALVSKDFTRPAQLALWRYMETDDVVEVDGLIEAEFARDKVIEELEIYIDFQARDGHESFDKLISFLRGVKRVISFTHMRIYDRNLQFDEFFKIDSIQELKSIAIYDYNSSKVLVSHQTRLPCQLQHLTITGFSKRVDDAVSGLIESSVSTLTSIRLEIIVSDAYFGSRFSSVLASFGPKLRKLDVTESYDTLIVSSLLPHCTSLKSLSIHSNDAFDEQDFKSMIDTLGTIPPSVILESFCITLPSPPNLIHFPSFVQLLKTSPFGQLRTLYMRTYSEYSSAPQELVEFVRGNDEFMDLLENRGIVLEFGTEEEVRLEAEKEKQRIYQERQVKLDLDSKE